MTLHRHRMVRWVTVLALSAGVISLSACPSSPSGSAPQATLTSIVVGPTSPRITIGEPQQFTATGTFSDNSTQNLTTTVNWTSSNTSIATISDTAGSRGLAKGIAVGGPIKITATQGSVSGRTSLTVTAAPAFPLKASTNNRYLVDQNGAPFLIVGDAPHTLMTNVDVTDATTYIVDRANHGFTTLWVEVLSNAGINGPANGCTLDSICPFTGTIAGSCSPSSVCYDLTKPNANYFARLRQLMGIAASYNLNIMLVIFDQDGWRTTFRQNGNAAVNSFGQYLGKTFKNIPNIIWVMGNDFQTWTTGLPDGTNSSSQASTDNTLAQQVMSGVEATDWNHLMTSELNFNISGSLDDSLLAPYTTFAAAYTYYPTYGETLAEYNSSAKTVPVFMEEGYFEDTTFGNLTPTTATNLMLRKQAYWTVTAGGLGGYIYGNNYSVTFARGWQSNIDTVAVSHLTLFANFFKGLSWFNFIPDQSHTVVTAGYGTAAGVNQGNGFGTGRVDTDNYVTTSYTADRTLVVSYVPASTTLTIAMTQFTGRVTARWFDPTNGTYATITGSPFPNSGSQNLATPGSNSAGDPDWVLLLQSAATK